MLLATNPLLRACTAAGFHSHACTNSAPVCTKRGNVKYPIPIGQDRGIIDQSDQSTYREKIEECHIVEGDCEKDGYLQRQKTDRDREYSVFSPGFCNQFCK